MTGGQTVRVRLSIAGGTVQGIVRRLSANIEVPMETEELSDVAIPAAGGRLRPTRAWAEILKVEVTVQQAPNFTADRVVIADKAASGPLIRGYGAGGAAPALIDATIKGIPQ